MERTTDGLSNLFLFTSVWQCHSIVLQVQPLDNVLQNILSNVRTALYISTTHILITEFVETPTFLTLAYNVFDVVCPSKNKKKGTHLVIPVFVSLARLFVDVGKRVDHEMKKQEKFRGFGHIL